MEQVDATKGTYGERIEKSPPFAKNVVVVFRDDVSVRTMKAFLKETTNKQSQDEMLREVIEDWNLVDEKGNKLPISIEGLDKINSIKLRDWIIATTQEIVVGTLTNIKKK